MATGATTMRSRSRSKPRCSVAKLLGDQRIRRSLTGQLRPDNVAAQIAREQTFAAHCRQGHIAGRESLQ